MFVLEEFESLLLNNLHLISVKHVDKHMKLNFAAVNKLSSFSVLINHFGHGCQVLQGDVDHLLWIACLKELELHTHQHQVE